MGEESSCNAPMTVATTLGSKESVLEKSSCKPPMTVATSSASKESALEKESVSEESSCKPPMTVALPPVDDDTADGWSTVLSKASRRSSTVPSKASRRSMRHTREALCDIREPSGQATLNELEHAHPDNVAEIYWDKKSSSTAAPHLQL